MFSALTVGARGREPLGARGLPRRASGLARVPFDKDTWHQLRSSV